MMGKDPGSIPLDDSLALFLTWTTYGSWLPGDERGWVEKPGRLRAGREVRASRAAADDRAETHTGCGAAGHRRENRRGPLPRSPLASARRELPHLTLASRGDRAELRYPVVSAGCYNRAVGNVT
ncbi:MAG: hypothetical protein O3C40_03530 [Planctomycetota bacterium]|nr:hypothetical protein [Planctomycetota bacterium]